MAVAGLMPLIGLVALLFFWGQTPTPVRLPEDEDLLLVAGSGTMVPANPAIRAAPSEVRE
jgi:hypothetical protein